MKFPWRKWFRKNKSMAELPDDIAIIGIACRFPGASNYHEFWENLWKGENSIREITPDRWDINKYYSPIRDEPNKSISKWGGLLEQIDKFDAPFFHISPREAQSMDPQQRLLLEEAWHCVEDSGIALHELQKSTTSVFVGVMATDYLHHMAAPDTHTDGFACLGNYEGILANRLSYFFNFSGQSQTIDNACASSLVVLHEAKTNILSGESQYALVGGVNVICHPWKYISFSKAHMLSPHGQCKTFDINADGYVPGEGVGLVLLTSLKNAIDKGHHIYGVIKASAVHHSGKTRTITSPNIETQRRLIEETHKISGFSPDTITYLEAHGTGTSLGDPIEVEALTQAFHTANKQYCYIGSAKTNIGHLEGAAGIAGLIKVLLMLKHKKIPKTLNIQYVNPIIDFANSPFIPAMEAIEWKLPNDVPTRRAGISSFGFGGVDSHVIIEEYNQPNINAENIQNSNTILPFVLSAKTNKSLTHLLQEWQQFIKTPDFANNSLEAICATLIEGRKHFPYRFATLVKSKNDLSKILQRVESSNVGLHSSSLNKHNIVLRLTPSGFLDQSLFEKTFNQHSKLRALKHDFDLALKKLKNGKKFLRVIEHQSNDFSVACRNYVYLYLFGKALLDHIHIHYVMGDGIGALAAATLSNMISFEQGVNYLIAKKPLIMSRPSLLAYIDIHDKKIINPYEVSVEYCRELFELVEVDTETEAQIFNLAQLMIDHQQTFKKYVYEWQHSLEHFDMDIKSAIDNPTTLPIKKKKLLIIIILLSLKKLNKKWDMADKLVVKNINVNEILDLLVDHVLDEEMLVKLMIAPTRLLYFEASEYINHHQDTIDTSKPYIILKKFNYITQPKIIFTDWHDLHPESIPDVENTLLSLVPDAKLIELVDRKSDAIGDISFSIGESGTGSHAFITELWQRGMLPSLQPWYPNIHYQKASLPGYVFDTKRYWINDSKIATSKLHQYLHPLVDADESNATEIIFKKILHPEEFFVKDHVVNGKTILPGTGYIEMVRAVGQLAKKQTVRSLHDVIWMRPIVVEQNPVPIKINVILGEGDARSLFSVYSEIDNSRIIYCEGQLSFTDPVDEPTLDIDSIRKRCSTVTEKGFIYQRLAEIGLKYGPYFHVTQRIYSNDNEMLVELMLPEVNNQPSTDFILHPSLMDGAVRTIFGQFFKGAVPPLSIPFSMDDLMIFRPIPSKCYAYAKPSTNDNSMNQYDIIICDPSGVVSVVIKGMSAREVKDTKEQRQTEVESLKSNPVTLSSAKETPININSTLQKQDASDNKPPSSMSTDIAALTRNYLAEQFSKVTGLPVSDVNLDKTFDEYGMDSIMILTFNQLMTADFPNLRKTLLFEHRNLESVAKHFLAKQKPQLEKLFGTASPPPKTEAKLPELNAPPKENIEIEANPTLQSNKNVNITDIAIIGISGRYPQSKNIEELWENLKSGKDCIEEIPKERWDYRPYYINEKGVPGKTNSKWGGFITDVDKFDPLFFNITPREAEKMDPQERISLETAYSAIEDAGYTPQQLQNASKGKVGVFVGVMWNEYQLLHTEQSEAKPEPLFTLGVFGSNNTPLANRISYYFNFQGPSIVLDTACSSSLVALHLACESLKRGECAYALACGVNLSLHPSKYVNMSQIGLLSSEGHCRSFGKGGDGYVPGEGVGVVLLKPLKEAINDGDIIYGVIKGTSVNHGGKTNGFTVPNPEAHTTLIKQALDNAQIEPNSLSYIEAHGTGTELGDPIEIAGLTNALEESLAVGSCPIGSIKANVGHLEGAAGIVAVTKVILQLKNKQLVPSILSETINPYINFSETPFYLQHKLTEWVPVKNFPRRAGISSFGAGGTNAHAIIEEAPVITSHKADVKKPFYLIALSAKSEWSLDKRISDLALWLKKHMQETNDRLSLSNIAYTLNSRRTHFDKRCAIVVDSLESLLTTLTQDNKDNASGIFLADHNNSKVSDDKHLEEGLLEIISKNQVINPDIYRAKLIEIAKHYVNGGKIDWDQIHFNESKVKTSLPTYPFERKQFWPVTANKEFNATPVTKAYLHPLIDNIIPDFDAIIYTKTFEEGDWVVKDHVVDKKILLPGAAYMQMAQAAGMLATQKIMHSLSNILWVQPFVMDKPSKRINLKLTKQDNHISFSFYTTENDVTSIYCAGEMTDQAHKVPPHLDLQSIKGRCINQVSKQEIYQRLEEMGFQYGSSYQVTDNIYYNDKEVLLRLSQSNDHSSQFSEYTMHPSLLDGIFRSLLGMYYIDKTKKPLTIPFAMDELIYFKPIPNPCFTYIKYKPQPQSTLPKVDITVTTESGEVVLLINGLSGKQLKKPIEDAEILDVEHNKALSLFHPEWVALPLRLPNPRNNLLSCLVFSDGEKSLTEWQDIVHEVTMVEPGERYEKINVNEYKIRPGVKEDYDHLINDLKSSGKTVNHIIHKWNINETSLYSYDRTEFQNIMNKSIFSLLFLFQALEKTHANEAIKCVFSYINNSGFQPQHEAVAGLINGLKIIKSNWQIACIEVDALAESRVNWNRVLTDELTSSEFQSASQIRYRGMDRFVRQIVEIDKSSLTRVNAPTLIRENGVYLITGGLGGLGQVFANYLTRKYKAKVILLGRRPIDNKIEETLNKLRSSGSEIIYLQGDVSNQHDVKRIYENVMRNYGQINGIIHSAGLISTTPFTELSTNEFSSVLAPKISGTQNLDEITKDDKLDFFAVFSSISSEVGDYGAGCYASANRFMDTYIELRDRLQQLNLRKGKSLAINWPYWEEGGMRLSEEEEALYFGYSGMTMLKTQVGIELFELLLKSNYPQVIVATGNHEKINRVFNVKTHEKHITKPQPASTNISPPVDTLLNATENYLKEIFFITTNIPVTEINSKKSYEEYGVDSIIIMKFNQELKKDFNDLRKTLLFEYQTLESLAKYLIAEHKSTLESALRKKKIIANDRTVNNGDSNKHTEGTDNLAELKASMVSYLKAIMAETTLLSHDEIDSKKSYEEYGIDSIIILKFNQLLSKDFPGLRKTILFEFQNLDTLADHLIAEQLPTAKKIADIKPVTNIEKKKEVVDTFPNLLNKELQDSHAIAIIGISGRYPSAENLEQFWEKLKSGSDCIQEIPLERWDYKKYFSEKKGEPGKIYSKWGGFIKDIDKFDSLFFNISPHDAKLMDPQERLLLQATWAAIEDAGYSSKGLFESSQGKVGVFTGNMWNEYQLLSQDTSRVAGFFGSNNSSLATRLSYFFNFHGPSLVIDTACSSSLVAVHIACQSILQGECDYAIAAGVNLSIHPNKYITLCRSRMLSSTGRCHSFGDNGDGYVPGEGVGVVLLKPLKKALEDNDNIYGVIMGSHVNHGGKTHGYTVPSPDAHAELIKTALIKSKVAPESISYIEAHGTGTALGDPIEITGLTKAFAQVTTKQSCPIGSVKSNVGHLEGAAGVVALTKVLLQLRHKQIVPSLHAEKLNPHVDFEKTPFYVQKHLSAWNTRNNEPRRAGISSFGAGGTNAHIVVQEPPDFKKQSHPVKPAYLITLSAKTEETLRQKLQELDNFLSKTLDEISLEDISYTLNTGRDHFSLRCACVVNSLDELKIIIKQMITGKVSERSRLSDKDKKSNAETAKDKDLPLIEALSSSITQDEYIHKLLAIADLYVNGSDIDFRLLHKGESNRKISLPTYPFVKESHWVVDNMVDQEHQTQEKIQKVINTHPNSEAPTSIYHSEWMQAPLKKSESITINGPVLVFDESSVLVSQLRESFSQEVFVHAKFKNTYQSKSNDFQINRSHSKDYMKLLNELDSKGSFPAVIVWRTNTFYLSSLSEADVEKCLQKTFYSLFKLSQALINKGVRSIKLLCMNESAEGSSPLFTEALAGFARTLNIEQPKITCRLVEYIEETALKVLLSEFNQVEEEVRYDKEGMRWVKRYKRDEYLDNTLKQTPLKKNGVYLITGGMGGLGIIFASYLAKHYQARLILTGRSKLNEAYRATIRDLERNGAQVMYLSADISKRADMKEVIQKAKTTFGHIDGIIHSAGVLRDAFILKKSIGEITEVLAPKVFGTLYLDEFTQDQPLDFFVTFSSISAVFGNIGQSDYSYANHFMDTFAVYREQLRTQGKRFGKTVSINWPFWLEGGMKINDASLKWLKEEKGLLPLSTHDGISAFLFALSQNKPQQVVLTGDQSKFDEFFEKNLYLSHTSEVIKTQYSNSELQEKAEQYLRKILSDMLQLSSDVIKPDESFENYGIDSIMIMNITQTLEPIFGSLSKTLFYEYPNLTSLVDYFVTHHAEKLNAILDADNSASRVKNSSANDQLILENYKKSFINDEKLSISLVPYNDIHVEVVEAGKGEVLLFLTPWGCISTAWRNQFAAFSNNYHVISIHYPGCGRSDFKPELIEFEQLVELIFHVLKKMKVKSPINLIGWSMGGLVAQYLLSKYPDLIKTLTLVNSAACFISTDKQSEFYNLIAFKEDFNLSNNIDNLTIDQINGVSSSTIRSLYFGKRISFDSRTLFEKISKPILLVAGKRDKIMPVQSLKPIFSEISNPEFHLIEGAGHYIPLFFSDSFNELLLKFLKKNE